MPRLLPFIVAAHIICGTIPSNARAQPASPATSRRSVSEHLHDVKSRMEAETAHLQETRSRQSSLQSGMDANQKELERISNDQSASNARLEKVNAEVTLLEKAVARVQDEIRTARGSLQQRTIAVYKMHRRTATLDYLINA